MTATECNCRLNEHRAPKVLSQETAPKLNACWHCQAQIKGFNPKSWVVNLASFCRALRKGPAPGQGSGPAAEGLQGTDSCEGLR